MAKSHKDSIGGYEIKEAEADFLIYLQDTHVEAGKQASPSECAFAQGVKTVYNCPYAWFYSTLAYIVLPDDKGDLYARRFKVSPGAQKQIIKFDLTGKADPGGYWFHVPTPGCTIEARRARDKKYQRDIAEGRRSLPTVKVKRKKAGNPKAYRGVRSGTGQVRFTQLPDSVKDLDA